MDGSLVWQFGILVGFGIVLAVSAHLVVKTAATLAGKLGVASFTLAFLMLGILTSTPEIFVAIQSSLGGVPQISMGNLLGGSILLLSLVIGGSSVILGKITLDHGLTFGEILRSSLVVAAPAAVLFDGSLTRVDGALLVGAYVGHVLFLNAKKHVLGHIKKHAGAAHGIGHSLFLLLIGLAGMTVAAKMIVDSASVISTALHIGPLVFGLVLLSLGTNLPEMALAVEGAIAKRRTLAFGDFLGSAAANTLILGILGIFSPFRVSRGGDLFVSLALLVIVSAFFVWTLASRKDITRTEGVGLLVFYALFVAFELLGA